MNKLAEASVVLLISGLAGFPLQACSSGAKPAAVDAGQGDDGAADGGDAQDSPAADSAGVADVGGADGAVADGGGGHDAATEDGAPVGAPVDARALDLLTAEVAAADGPLQPLDAGPSHTSVMVTVPATANILGAGHSMLPPDLADHPGTFPVLVELPVGIGRTMTLTNVSGGIAISGEGSPTFHADGFAFTPNPLEGTTIGGLTLPAATHHAFLQGVFLGPSEPANPGPPSYVADITASTFNGITLAQCFFIGDGLDGAIDDTGDVQVFRVPDGATRLFLGFFEIDYGDNIGAETAQVNFAR